MERPHTSIKQWLAQQQPSETILVTGVRLNQTSSGLEMILETTASDQIQATTKTEGNNFIADIPNTQQRLTSNNFFCQ